MLNAESGHFLLTPLRFFLYGSTSFGATPEPRGGRAALVRSMRSVLPAVHPPDLLFVQSEPAQTKWVMFNEI
jgi:hypothetical protein